MQNSEINRGDLLMMDGEPCVVMRKDSDRMALIYPGDEIPPFMTRAASDRARWVWTEGLKPRPAVTEDARSHRVETGGPGNWGTVGLYTGKDSYAAALEAARKRHAMSPRTRIRIVLEEVLDTFGPEDAS